MKSFHIFFSRDILLGLMKRLVKRRASNLKVLVTSATLDGDKVSKFFSDCPVMTVPGKLYPVEILYSKERPKSYLESSFKTALGMIRSLVYLLKYDNVCPLFHFHCSCLIIFLNLFCFFLFLLHLWENLVAP